MYRVQFEDRSFRDVVVVGCGGTGSFVAEGLCRLLPAEKNIILVDHDRVEPRNLGRQLFYEGDVGGFKSEALAKRLARNYKRALQYSVYPYSTGKWVSLIIGCVDNAAAREMMSSRYQGWWLDCGNSYHSGQVLIGNSSSPDSMKGSFYKGITVALPIPSWQEPSLLTAVPPAPQDCAQAVEAGDQSPLINQVMATIALEFVRRLLAGTLTWMGMYIDMEVGSMRPVEIELPTVARITGLNQKALLHNEKASPGRWR